MVFSGFELADGRAGENQEIEPLEQRIYTLAKFCVAHSLPLHFFGAERCAPREAFGNYFWELRKVLAVRRRRNTRNISAALGGVNGAGFYCS